MGTNKDRSFEENLAQLERDGFLLIKNVLDRETVQKWRDSLYGRYNRGEYDRRTVSAMYRIINCWCRNRR